MKRYACIALILLRTASAHAQSTERDAQARAAAEGGAALFRDKDFVGAASQFRAAHELNGDPSYLFNAAQAYRHAGDCAQAADYYARFLAEVPDPPNADKVRAWYASQLECAKPSSQPPPPTPQQPIPAPAIAPTRGHRALTIGLAVASAGAFAVGGFFVWDARYLDNQRDAALAACTVGTPCSAAVITDYDHRGSRANTLGLFGLGVGTLALATSAALFMWTW
ncbi:MAG: hypothetical protein H0T89_06070 [Deltaproteobacteria bacterium]|nr:hypothetical protein [Deltaproteobacteria bacterium]MDQ3296929.1 hypothetical protein [Myxococcota bacterium]